MNRWNMKDAKGHGSNPRGGSGMGHHEKILRDNLKNPLKGLFLGGPQPAEAESILRSQYGYNDKQIGALKGGGDPRYNEIIARNPALTG